jgi:uncharacterized protein (DUF3084 family)
MNSTPNTKDALIARADEQLARAYEQIARADEQLVHVTEQFSKIERDAARDPSVGTGPQPPRGRPARRGLTGLLLAVCIVSIVVAAFVSQSSRDGVKLIGAQWALQLISTPSLPLKNSPFPAQPDPSPIQVTAAEAAPPQAAPLAHTRPQDAATAAAAASELTQLLQKMTGDLANLEQRMEQLKAKQDQIANDNAKAIEQLKTKQEEMTRQLAKVSEQSALPKTSPPSAGPTQSPLARTRPQAPPRRQYPPRWQYYDEW